MDEVEEGEEEERMEKGGLSRCQRGVETCRSGESEVSRDCIVFTGLTRSESIL